MIPRRFYWVVDTGVVVIAFLAAAFVAPLLQAVLVRSGAFDLSWLAVLSLPAPAALGRFRPLQDQIWILMVMVAATFLCMHALDGYRPFLKLTRARIIVSAVMSSVIGLSFITLVLFTVRANQWSRLFIFLFALLSAIGLASYRLILRTYRRMRSAAGVYSNNIALIAPAAIVPIIVDYFKRHVPLSDYRLAGVLDIGDAPSAGPAAGSGLPSLGSVRSLGSLLIHRPIHEVIAVQPLSGADWLPKVIEDCDYFRVTLRIVPEALLQCDTRDLVIHYHADPLRLPEVVLRPPELDSDSLFVKRLIDVVVASMLLVVLTPVFLLIGIALKLTTPRQPIFYPWRVIGYKGKPFTGYKFTTMVADADALKPALMGLNEMTGPVFKIKNDPRVTPLGRWLRKYSLNELPQLWSVLKGDMSLVGPRPAGPHELERYELWHKRKLSVRPGITCLWQVRGRNKISDFNDWVRMDLEYIDGWSLWLDFKILARTAWTVVAGSGS